MGPQTQQLCLRMAVLRLLLPILLLVITSIQRCTHPRKRKQWGRQCASWPTWTSPSMEQSDLDLESVPQATRMPNKCLPQWTRVSMNKSDPGLESEDQTTKPFDSLPTWINPIMDKSDQGLESGLPILLNMVLR